MTHSDTPADTPRSTNLSPIRFGRIDALIILLVLWATWAAFPRTTPGTALTVAVYEGQTPLARFPLGTNRVFAVDGVLGPMQIGINNGSAQVLHAECPRGVCMSTGAIRQPGQQIVCVPNQVIVRIEHSGLNAEELDGIVR